MSFEAGQPLEIAFSKYQLTSQGNIHSSRVGALLRVKYANHTVGYADCHPWVELGDASLDQQLNTLAQGEKTALTAQSLVFAKLDAETRASNTHLFYGLETPLNHYHFSDGALISEERLTQISQQGIKRVKVKVGNDLIKDSEWIHKFADKLRSCDLKLRLDFNCKLQQKQFEDFLKQGASILDVINFFEDPFTFDPISWQQLREKYPIKLACDRESLKALDFPESCDFLVVKPAIQEITPFLSERLKNRFLVLTSYLDHPVGQLSSLHVASKVLKNYPHLLSECGFLSHHAYQPSDYSQMFQEKDARLIPSSLGTGWGYDHLLPTLDWKPL